MAEDNALDVRSLKPIRRHEKLLQLFDDLPVGESFVFINDHDPKPLYYEFQSIYGDVVGWEYLNRDSREWKVKVTRTDASRGRELDDASTLIDLRKTEQDDWKHVVFHRYGMMSTDTTMKLISGERPEQIEELFESRFEGKHRWSYEKEGPDEFVAHIKKLSDHDLETSGAAVVEEFDLRPYPPAKRHDMVFETFEDLEPDEAFIFTNDHDPKPLYYQMEAESDVDFRWDYLDEGPEKWRVKIVKSK
jgi:uncharacterized protein (DUF2249 family)